MIHPSTCTSPKFAAERPSMLDLSQPSNSSNPSLASLGSATMLDLSNPNVLNTLGSEIIFTPNTEQMLLTTLAEVVASQGLNVNAAASSSAPVTAVSPSRPQDTTSVFNVPIMVAAEEEETKSSEVCEVEEFEVMMENYNRPPQNVRPSTPAQSIQSEEQELEQMSDLQEEGSEYSQMSMDSMDPQVAQAVRDSHNIGSLTPLIKTELKCTIQKKRIQAGKDEISPEELLQRKDTNEKLSPEEEERRQRRRERNKIAAQKCRGKRREKADMLEEEVSTLESSNADLRSMLEKLEQEKEKLRRLLCFHDNQSSKCPKRQRLSEEVEEEEEELLEVLLDGQTEPYDESVQIVIN